MSPDFELLVVGGGPAGLSAVRGFRDAGGEGRVAIVSDEHRMPYRRPPLTKELLRGEISEDELPLEDETWLAKNGVSLVSGRAVALDVAAHEVSLSGGRQLTYACCVLSTGSEPTRLPVRGADDPSVRVVRSLDHVRELLHRLSPGGEVIVIGSGFIGCEIAASLRRRDASVTLVSDEPAPNGGRLGARAGAEIARWLRDEGVRLELGVAVEAIERHGQLLRVSAGSTSVTGSLVVMAAGVAPRSELLLAYGTPLEDGAIPVDASMRTALPDLFAAGDVCKAENATAGRSLRVEHWGDALAQGEVAGRAAARERAEWGEVPGFWSTIGGHTLKYAAWGDGYDESRFESPSGGGFVVWYGRDEHIVGVLTHRADEQYERGRRLIEEGAPWA
ncbi:MAG TPA: FAD-dependent oxidoreductase [Solirubrobacteraceae bacterium]|jgi:NADPH-dependent 2,4-dienoyl-CoA reductase/sulfur reductase-like enzyme|nr:FAD-dependent oxidoreductase [Solirubrobacteraceae bacterium]